MIVLKEIYLYQDQVKTPLFQDPNLTLIELFFFSY